MLVSLTGCTRRTAEEAPPLYAEISVTDAAQHQQAGSAQFFDANTPGYRQKFGKVPGAHVLDSYREYDVNTTLPADRAAPIIFYCTSRL